MDNTVTMDPGATAAAGAAALIPMLIIIVLSVFMLVAMWKVYTKAGKPGWGVIIPIYNMVLLLQIAGKPVWWIILCFVPIVNLVIIILTYAAMAKAFGKGAGFVLGLIFLPIIFWPILGFGSAEYQGTAAVAPEPQAPTGTEPPQPAQ